MGGTYARLVYTWYKNIFHMISVLIVFLAANEKSNQMKKYQNYTATRQKRDSVTISDAKAKKSTHKRTRPEQDIDETGTKSLKLANK